MRCMQAALEGNDEMRDLLKRLEGQGSDSEEDAADAADKQRRLLDLAAAVQSQPANREHITPAVRPPFRFLFWPWPPVLVGLVFFMHMGA